MAISGAIDAFAGVAGAGAAADAAFGGIGTVGFVPIAAGAGATLAAVPAALAAPTMVADIGVVSTTDASGIAAAASFRAAANSSAL
jgi:hypothetical protein